MSPAQYTPLTAAESIAPDVEQRVYFRQVFAWMAAGLALTGVIAYAIGMNAALVDSLFAGQGRFTLMLCVLIEFALVYALVGLVQHMNLVEAAIIFLVYCAINGVIFSAIFAVFTTASIFSTFLVAAVMFAALAVFGYTTDVDLTSWRAFLLMALIGQIIGLLVNLYWFSQPVYWLTTAAGLFIFSAFTAYDVQKLKQYNLPDQDVAATRKAAIVGALALYLDFVNLFLYLLRLLGRRR